MAHKQVVVELSILNPRVHAGGFVMLKAKLRYGRWFARPTYYFASDAGPVRHTYRGGGYIDTTGIAPGMYLVKVHGLQGSNPWDMADASGHFEVLG